MNCNKLLCFILVSMDIVGIALLVDQVPIRKQLFAYFQNKSATLLQPPEQLNYTLYNGIYHLDEFVSVQAAVTA